MLLAEANQWPEDAVAYFGNGDESHMNFHFPLMPRMFMALQMEDRFPIIDILEQTPADSRELPVGDVPAQSRRAHARDGDRRRARLHVARLRERSARRASISAFAAGSRRLLANSRRKIELLNILLFSMPGTPVLYYGDEIGMGDNFYLGDRNGCRTPMQWSPRSQRRFFQGESAAALSADHDRSGISLRSDQRRKPAEESVVAALVDAARHRDAQEFQGVLARLARISCIRKIQRCSPFCAGTKTRRFSWS